MEAFLVSRDKSIMIDASALWSVYRSLHDQPASENLTTLTGDAIFLIEQLIQTTTRYIMSEDESDRTQVRNGFSKRICLAFVDFHSPLKEGRIMRQPQKCA
jgi:hypothetical protein